MMKSFFKKLAFIMALAMVVSLAAPAAQASAAETQEFTYAYQNGGKVTKLYMDAEETVDLKFVGVKNYADKKSDLTTNWVSYPKSVATVDKNGVVTAVADGEAIVYLEITDKTGEVTYTSTAVDVVVGKELAPVKLGTSKNDLADIDTVYELAIGDAVDLAFFGVPNYNKTNYTVTWVAVEDVLADEVVEAAAVQVDQKGVVVAVAEGEADVMALIVDNMTGEVLAAEWVNFKVVAAAEPTVEPTPEVTEAPEVTETPEEPTVEPTPEVTEAPALSIEAKQTTEMALALTFTGVDVTKLTKENIEIYEYFEDEIETQEYVWQIHSISVVDAEAGVIAVVGYTTDEFKDGANYVVRYVEVKDEGTVEERSEVYAEDTFVASVGAVTTVDAWYASYEKNNNVVDNCRPENIEDDWWQFYMKAYTNAGSGEEIKTKVFYELYDANGINVTGHYERLVDDDLVDLELVNDTKDFDSYIEWDEDKNEILFLDILEAPVYFKVSYSDWETGETVDTELRMVVEEAPAYEIEAIDDWCITINDHHRLAWDNKQKEIALFDDYDQSAEAELMNHELVLWFTDNYGNKYVTSTLKKFVAWPYSHVSTSEKFTGEGFELRYESRNPQIIVVGDESDTEQMIDGAVTSSILTTKKTGTASINVTLYNAFDEELKDRLGIVRVSVKPERKLTKAVANGASVTTDSKSFGADPSRVFDDVMDNASADVNVNTYDNYFTTSSVSVNAYDQYGASWGCYNTTLSDNLVINAETTNVELSDVDTWGFKDEKYSAAVDGVQLYAAVGDKVSSIAYKVTVTDTLHEVEKTDNFRVTLKYPSEDKDTHILQCKSKLQIKAGSVGFTQLATEIQILENSNNGYAVNFADNVVVDDDGNITNIINDGKIDIVTTKAEYNALFGSSRTATASEGALYLVVYNPKNNIIGMADESSTATGAAIGLKELESGRYVFNVADTMDATAATVFAEPGNYTVKLIKVTAVDANDKVKSFTTNTSRFSVTDDRMDINFVNQEAIYVADDVDYAANGINGIAQNAIKYDHNFGWTYWVTGNNDIPVCVSGVRFKKNARAKQVVINDAFIKVAIDTNWNGVYDEGVDPYYYVEVDVEKTVTLEDMSIVDGDDTVKANYDPEGNKVTQFYPIYKTK